MFPENQKLFAVPSTGVQRTEESKLPGSAGFFIGTLALVEVEPLRPPPLFVLD